MAPKGSEAFAAAVPTEKPDGKPADDDGRENHQKDLFAVGQRNPLMGRRSLGSGRRGVGGCPGENVGVRHGYFQNRFGQRDRRRCLEHRPGACKKEPPAKNRFLRWGRR
jgi:hypothetical protein